MNRLDQRSAATVESIVDARIRELVLRRFDGFREGLERVQRNIEDIYANMDRLDQRCKQLENRVRSIESVDREHGTPRAAPPAPVKNNSKGKAKCNDNDVPAKKKHQGQRDPAHGVEKASQFARGETVNLAGLLALNIEDDTVSVTEMVIGNAIAGIPNIAEHDVSLRWLFNAIEELGVGRADHYKSSYKELESVAFPKRFSKLHIVDMSYMFSGCKNLDTVKLSALRTSSVTSMLRMFLMCEKLTTIDLGSFNTSSVTNMREMFNGCKSLTGVTFGPGFDTSEVTDMSSMFCDCKCLKKIDLSNFNTGKVVDMWSMFSGCSAMADIQFGQYFSTGNVLNMGKMFYNCEIIRLIDCSEFVFNDRVKVHDMFAGCRLLRRVLASPENEASVNRILSEGGITNLAARG